MQRFSSRRRRARALTPVPSPTTLVEHQSAVAAAIRQVLDGPARRHERAALLALRDGYERALRDEAGRLVRHRFATTGDDTVTRSDLVKLVTGSIAEVIGTAHRDHYETSIVERVRHFFELTARRRLAAALINAMLFGLVTVAAIQSVEALPIVNKTRALATGAGVLGFALRYIRPRQVVRAIVSASGDRIKKQARAGVNKYPTDVLAEIRHEIADITDKELRRRLRYELLAERHHGSMVQMALSDALLEISFTSDAEQQRAIDVSITTAIEWLYALYGLDLNRADPLSRR